MNESVLVQIRVAEKEKQLLLVKSLAVHVQGKSLELMATEQNDVTWKSYMFNRKSGTLKFLLHASIDTLPIAVLYKMGCYFHFMENTYRVEVVTS